MYIFINSIRNLIRYRRRYLIAMTGLVGILSFCFYGMVYYPIIRDYNDTYERELLSRVEMRFRDDLQYMQNRGKDDTAINYVDERENFNADGSMDVYDYDLFADRAYFEQFTDSSYVTEMELGYGCRVYREMTGKSGGKPDRKGLVLYGGSLDTLNYYLNEMTYRDFPREIHVAEGREAEPGQGECMLYRKMAVYNNLEIGDKIELYDEDGGELIRLDIVGLVTCYINYGDRLEEEDENMLGYRIGSMPYRRLNTTLLYHVFTDFDTAYGVYGTSSAPRFAEHHTFNNYIPVFQLITPAAYDGFAAELDSFMYDRNLHFYPLKNACRPYLREYDEQAAGLTVLLAGGLSMVSAAVMLGILMRERSRETGILMAVGVKKRQIFTGWLTENTFMLTVTSAFAFFLAAYMDRILHLFGKTYFVRQFFFEAVPESVFAVILSLLILICLTAAEIYGYLSVGSPVRRLMGK